MYSLLGFPKFTQSSPQCTLVKIFKKKNSHSICMCMFLKGLERYTALYWQFLEIGLEVC